MAELTIQGDELVVHLSTAEKLDAVHGEVRVPLDSVKSVEVLDDAMGAIHGIRVGTGVPGLVAIGTFTSRTAKIFAVVHHDTPAASGSPSTAITSTSSSWAVPIPR